MRVAVDTLELPVSDGVLTEVGRAVSERVGSPMFAGVRDLRLRFRKVQGALLCIAAVGLTSGGLATSTATSTNALDAAVRALDGLPGRIDRVRPRSASSAKSDRHAAVRSELKKLLDRA